ncbi:MAG: ricin-type beta-trefoil lectin domain protein [Pseudomonadota bacterium]
MAVKFDWIRRVLPRLKLGVVAGLGLVLASCETLAVSTLTPAGLSAQDGYTGRIRLTRFLDEPDGYCLDVPGPATNVMLQFPMVAHTCHFGPLPDQVFQFNTDGTGKLRWTMDEYDLCFTADKAEALSAFNLRECGSSPLQSFELTENNEFKLSGTDLCMQVERTGAGPMQPPGEGQDAYGRGRSVNAQFTHLMRRLELRTCGEGDPAMSRWQAVTEAS